MITDKKYNNGSIIFIPDYAYKSISACGYTLDKLYNMTLNVTDDYYDMLKALSKDLDKVSGSDIKDIFSMNSLMYKRLFNVDMYPSLFSGSSLEALLGLCDYSTKGDSMNLYRADTSCENELIKLYNNKNIDNKSILLNGNSKNELFSLEYTDDTMLVIIHDGFTNFILSNDIESKKMINRGLMDYFIERLGLETFNKSRLLNIGLDIANKR